MPIDEPLNPCKHRERLLIKGGFTYRSLYVECGDCRETVIMRLPFTWRTQDITVVIQRRDQ